MQTQALTNWHRQQTAGNAKAHPLTPTTPVRARGNDLVAQNDEPESEEVELERLEGMVRLGQRLGVERFARLMRLRERKANDGLLKRISERKGREQ